MALRPGWANLEFFSISSFSSCLGVTRLATDEAYFGKSCDSCSRAVNTLRESESNCAACIPISTSASVRQTGTGTDSAHKPESSSEVNGFK